MLNRNLAITLFSAVYLIKSEFHINSSYNLEGTSIKENKMIQTHPVLKVCYWKRKV